MSEKLYVQISKLAGLLVFVPLFLLFSVALLLFEGFLWALAKMLCLECFLHPLVLLVLSGAVYGVMLSTPVFVYLALVRCRSAVAKKEADKWQ